MATLYEDNFGFRVIDCADGVAFLKHVQSCN
jgi:hypothetical protein